MGDRRLLARYGPAGLGLLLGVLALGPALGPGFVLRYDMVFVPDPPPVFGPVFGAVFGSAGSGGFPRAVPSDQVVALLSLALPAQVVQKLTLVGIFVLAASGAAALVPSDRTAGRLAAAAFYAWNAYLAQRLLLGQWALLLGFAGLPWAVRAAARGASTWRDAVRLAVALVPAAIGGFQATLVSAITVLPVAALTRRARAVPVSALVIAVLSLPWLVPALGSHAVTDPAGVDAFAARADGPFGTLGSLLTLGGIWNAEAEVPGQGSWGVAAVRLALTVVALAGFVGLARAGWGRTALGLAVAAAVGLGVACLGAFAPGVLKGLIGWWPGFGPFRDGQLFIAPLVLCQALGFGFAVHRLGRLGLAAAAVPVLALPTFALGAFGRLAAVDYPGEWRRVQALVNADPAPGALVSLPWGAHRAFAWNGGRVILDPATKMFARPVVWDDTLVVERRAGGVIRVAPEAPRARRIGDLVRGGHGPLTGELARQGVRFVLVERPNENEFLSRLPGARPIFRGGELLLLRL
ncbi:hypothetical protein [Microtetraspora sp. NBRC 16547]|uniref:hypothetical protein n=1 Tax=Microtetraspora sp. NBRC 16547 TaxID=3030993 RepID=UPI0024A13B11|nr:hypothetical protein [Microtetraspora sp. NBRC 16547]GLW95961.1 hypothetical protein Misp02_00480 [Microtetraspora sp. NBRC 16547]